MRTFGKRYELFGERLTVAELAELAGVRPRCMRSRLKSGVLPDVAITLPPEEPQLVQAFGREWTVDELAREYGIKKVTFYGRMRRGLTAEQACTIAVKNPKPRYVFNGKNATIPEIAKESGVNVCLLRARLAEGISLEDAVKHGKRRVDPRDHVGKKYNRLRILAILAKKRGGSTLALCECECGNKPTVRVVLVVNGRSKSCGCANETVYENRRSVLVGRRFGLLTVRGVRSAKPLRLDCDCDCGGSCVRRPSALRNTQKRGGVSHCGCRALLNIIEAEAT